MASDFGWAVNGIPFETAFGPLFLTDATLWRPPVEVRRTAITIPGQHGSVSPGLPVYGEPKLPIVLRSIQASQAALEEAVNQAITILTGPNITLSRTSGTRTTSAVAQLESLTPEDFTYRKMARITAVYAIPGVFFREAAALSTDNVFSSDLVNVEIATLSASTAPIPDAVVRITGPCVNPSVTDPWTGTGISWAGTVAAGQYLFLCPRPLSARLSSSSGDWLSGGTSVVGAVSWPATGRLQLWPVVQSATTRKVLLSATGTSKTAATKLCVRAGASYL